MLSRRKTVRSYVSCRVAKDEICSILLCGAVAQLVQAPGVLQAPGGNLTPTARYPVSCDPSSQSFEQSGLAEVSVLKRCTMVQIKLLAIPRL